jgi:GNAT superfamily N-acetyltransferase
MGARSGILGHSVSTWPAPRALLQHEWPAFRAALNRVFRPGGGDLTDELPLLFAGAPAASAATQPPLPATSLENLRVVVDDAGTILGHAGYVRREAQILKRRTAIGFIAAVFTDAAHRGRRLGTRVLLDALGRVRPGADLVLASGDRDFYRRHGFEPVPPLTRFRLPPAETLAGAVGEYELRTIGGNPSNAAAGPGAGQGATPTPLTPGELAELQGLHAAEPVHFVRSDDDWLRLLAAGRLVDAPATFTLVTRAGRPVAFVAAQNATPRPDGSIRPRRILEVTGDRNAILSVAPLLGEELLVPAYDSASIDRAVAIGLVRTVRQFPITAEPLTATARVVPWYGLNYL